MNNYLKIDQKFNLSSTKTTTKKMTTKINKSLLSINSLNIGAYLITPILLGVFIGYNLDIYLNSKPIFILFFILLGTYSSFYNLFKLTKE
ncbi:MAG: AtpZ/AtpI family protein [bacterium]|nr:AtpZ/AtpI family protein [bacterium]